ncbi:MAG TPA: LLM class flavin-dependent oxidoreductase [Chloroflexota bacterium]|nr:LLM class flavin-dependent oxidoreductase [Chloroflexota bacterium]
MKLWLFDITFWLRPGDRTLFPYPGRLWDPGLGMETYHGHLDYLRRADELGIDGVCLTEHHYAPYGMCPAPNVMAAAVAGVTSNCKLVLMGNCLPLHPHPVRMAEELSMVDILSRGRLVSGFIRGGFTEWFAYSLKPEETRTRFEEAWELIVKCWTEPEPFAWHGQHFNYDNISIMPRPVQQPHPPLLMAASTAESIEWAVKHRVPLASSFAPVDSMRETFAYYRECAAKDGWTPGPEYFMVSRQVYVAPTNQQARAEAEPYLMAFMEEVPVARKLTPKAEEYRQSARTGRSFAYKSSTAAGHQFLAESTPGGYTFDQLQRDGLCIIGDPDYVTAEIRRQSDELGGIGTFMAYAPFSTMPLALATNSLELLTREVQPSIRDYATAREAVQARR